MRLFYALVAAWMLALAPFATAQNPFSPALTVNEGVITHYDINQRMALIEALGARGDLRSQAIEQLTEDRLKVQTANGLGIELPEGAIELGLEEFAVARGLTVDQVLQTLTRRGIDRTSMDDFVEAGILWREVVQTRFRDRAQPSETDLDTALELNANTPREYLQLAEIALPFEERGEAETLGLADRLSRELSRGGNFTAAVRNYSRSASAARGGVLDPIPSVQLPPAIRSQVLLLSPGEVTAPIPIAGGVAILKLLAIRQEAPGTPLPAPPVAPPSADDGQAPQSDGSSAGALPQGLPDEFTAREELRQQLFLQRITSFGQGYLQELLGDALIVER